MSSNNFDTKFSTSARHIFTLHDAKFSTIIPNALFRFAGLNNSARHLFPFRRVNYSPPVVLKFLTYALTSWGNVLSFRLLARLVQIAGKN
jgi:glycogen synthase